MSGERRTLPPIHELIVTLDDVAGGVVWRRVRVSGGATLARANRVLCALFSWPSNQHYAFEAGPVRYEGGHPAAASSSASGGTSRAEVTDVRLRQLLPDAGAALAWEYGDLVSWSAQVCLERTLPPNESIVTPWCTGGDGVTTSFADGPWGSDPILDLDAAWVESHRTDGNGSPSGRARPRFALDAINAELSRLRRSG